MVCYKDCTQCSEHEDCSLDGEIDLKYIIVEIDHESNETFSL